MCVFLVASRWFRQGVDDVKREQEQGLRSGRRPGRRRSWVCATKRLQLKTWWAGCAIRKRNVAGPKNVVVIFFDVACKEEADRPCGMNMNVFVPVQYSYDADNCARLKYPRSHSPRGSGAVLPSPGKIIYHVICVQLLRARGGGFYKWENPFCFIFWRSR